jgi:hypothetical protein
MAGFPSTNTSVPSAGGLPARAASRFHMQQRTWLAASRRLKYQWPLGHALQATTSPRTQSGMNSPSTTRLAAAVSRLTDQTSSVGSIGMFGSKSVMVR